MITVLSALVSLLSFRLRSRSSLELELIALRHQVTVLRRQRPGRPKLFRADRFLWVWLYRIWPKVLDTMVLLKPATVIDWHRKGFRLYWRRRSCPIFVLYRRPLPAPLSPSHRSAACTIATSVARPELFSVTEPATPSQCCASTRSAIGSPACRCARTHAGSLDRKSAPL